MESLHCLEGIDSSKVVGGLVIKKKPANNDRSHIFKKPEHIVKPSVLGLDKLAAEKVSYY